MLLLAAPALAASLDNLEIGGPWGTPTATDATAAWWNPAGLAAGEGTRIMAEGAPTFATVTYERAEPNGGSDIYRLSGVVPYFGLATDLGVPGLGLGLALAVPSVRGGAEAQEPGSGAWHMREGDVRAIHAIVGAGFDIAGRVAIGASAHLVRSSWIARVDTDTLPDLAHALEAEGEDPGYTDANLEDPAYTATLQFEELSDVTATGSLGARVRIDPGIAIGVTYIHGATVDNTGGVSIQFGCPPETDTLGRYAAERAGTCHETVEADASVAYTLPNRLHGAISWEPNEMWTLTAMGGWVQWSVYQDFQVAITNPEIQTEEGRELIEQTKSWARANVDSGWAALDVKARPAPKWTVGGRVLFDGAAVPDAALSTNNYDADDWIVSVLGAWRPVPALEIGASWSHQFLADRTVESAFYQTLDGEPNEERWNYPHASGTYTGAVDRIGVQARVMFGGGTGRAAASR